MIAAAGVNVASSIRSLPEHQRAAVRLRRTVKQIRDLLVAGTKQTGQSDDLSGADGQRQIRHLTAGEVLDRDRSRSTANRNGSRLSRLELAADDHTHHRIARGTRRRHDARDLAITQYRCAIGDFQHLVDVV